VWHQERSSLARILAAIAMASGATIAVTTLPVFAAFGAAIAGAISWCIWLDHADLAAEKALRPDEID
jgi:hypothetical protein